MLSIWLSFGEMPQKSTKTRTSMTMLSCDAMGSWAMLSAYAKPDTANMAENVSAKSSSMGASGDARGTYRETIRRPQKNKTTTPRPREGREGERREDGEPRHLDGVLRQKIREAVELHARARRRLAPEDGAVAAEDAERREGRREAHAEVQHEEERLRVLELEVFVEEAEERAAGELDAAVDGELVAVARQQQARPPEEDVELRQLRGHLPDLALALPRRAAELPVRAACVDVTSSTRMQWVRHPSSTRREDTSRPKISFPLVVQKSAASTSV